MRVWQRRRRSAAKGLAAGLIGGLAASWVMNRFQDGMAKLGKNRSEAEGQAHSGAQGQTAGQTQAGAEGESSEPATRVVATAIAEKVFHHELQPAERPRAETAVHYGYGALAGGAYGVAAEYWPQVRAGAGSLSGAGLWLASDEIGLTMLGLAKPPKAYPAKVHASALAAHVVYGVSLELSRRALRNLR